MYRAAADAVLHRESVFGDYVRDQLRLPLPFIYPPIAAVLAVPLTLVGETSANLLWTAATVALLAWATRVCFAAFLARHRRAAAWLLLTGAMLALTPVEDHLRFGQVGIPLMALCLADCTATRPRWPRGALVGLAAAVKLVPAIFVPYLWLSGRRRAAITATATFAALSLAGFVVAPSDSWRFWTDKLFEPTSPDFYTNQSLQGVLRRAIAPWPSVWIPVAVSVALFGLARAAAAARAGDELRGLAITGLVGVLVSPVSWIHHLVWVVPALAVILGDGIDRRRVAAAFTVSALFTGRLVYLGAEEMYSHGFLAVMLRESYGLLCVGLFVYLTGAIPLARRALATRAVTTPA